jgi:phosphohistidine phosphatase
MVHPREETPRILHLLRHAKSSWRDPGLDDRDRPLNARGTHAGELMATLLAREPRPDLVLCSDALRTRQTWEHIARAYGKDLPPVSLEAGLYLATARALVERIEALEDGVARLLVIGHNPGLHELALALARHGPRHDRSRLAAKFPTAGLATFRLAGPWHAISHAQIALASYVVPSDLDATDPDSD